jgi:hypothetical protein
MTDLSDKSLLFSKLNEVFKKTFDKDKKNTDKKPEKKDEENSKNNTENDKSSDDKEDKSNQKPSSFLKKKTSDSDDKNGKSDKADKDAEEDSDTDNDDQEDDEPKSDLDRTDKNNDGEDDSDNKEKNLDKKTDKDDEDREGKKSPNIIQYQKFSDEVVKESQLYKSLLKKSQKYNIPLSTIGEIYDNGLYEWDLTETILTPEQFAFSRVNSYLSKGRAYIEETLSESENKTRPLYFGVALTKGNWGKEKFKHITWSVDHPTRPNLPQPDGLGDNKLNSTHISKKIYNYPSIKQHLKDGWKISEGTGLASLDKKHISDSLNKHAKTKLGKYGHYNLRESEEIDTVCNDEKHKKFLLKSKQQKIKIDEVRSAAFRMVKVKLPSGELGWRKFHKDLNITKSTVEKDPDDETNTGMIRLPSGEIIFRQFHNNGDEIEDDK